jgi:hypothetical protein
VLPYPIWCSRRAPLFLFIHRKLVRPSAAFSDRGAWREREYQGRVLTHKTFRSFIETMPIEGCGWPLDKVERLIKDDAETLALWRKAVTAKDGRPAKTVDNINSLPRSRTTTPTTKGSKRKRRKSPHRRH